MASRPPAPDEPGDLRICTPALPSDPQLVAAQTLLPPDVGGTSGGTSCSSLARKRRKQKKPTETIKQKQ
ncbi:unnamed protein product [Urochloa humidicola]